MDELMHHGILGMKWGVRRTPEQLGHKKKNNEKRILKGAAIVGTLSLGVGMVASGVYLKNRLTPGYKNLFYQVANAIDTPLDGTPQMEKAVRQLYDMWKNPKKYNPNEEYLLELF